MVRHLTREEFLVSFLVDARGGCLEAQRLPGMRIWVPPDAVLSPSRIIFRLLRPEALPSPPQLDDCHGYACRILQLQSSSLRFQKPILIEMPHVAALQNGRELLVLRRNPESHSWKEHSFSMDDAALRETFGPFYESLSDAATLRDRRIVRIATTDVPGYLSVVSVHRRNRAVIGPDGGVIHSDVDPRIRVQFPPGSLQKKIPISLEVQQMPFSSFSEPGMGQVSVSPIVTVEPKRRKFRDNIQVQLPLPPDCPQSQDLSTLSAGLRLLFSIYEHGTRWEDVTDSVELTISDGGIASHPTRISARVWLVYAPEMNAAAVANRIYAAHHACPYIGRFLVYARRHDEHECQLRIMLITDDSADKTLECQENFSVVQTGSEVELTIGTRYRVEMAGNLVPLTKLDEVVAMSPAPFQENRVTVPVRVRDADRSFCGKVALLPLPLHEMEQELAPPATPVTTLSVQVPDHIVQMDGTLRQPHRKKKITDSYRRSMRDSDPIARSELDVMLVAAAVGGDWPQLAAELGLQEPEPNAMASSDEEKALAGLVAWGGDGNRLNEALRAIGREDVVKTCLSSITLIQDEGEAESARKRLDRNDGNEDKDNWELVKPVVGSGGISGGSTGEADDGRALPPESVDESMIVETGDDDEDYDLGGSGTRQHRERDLSDVSDHSIRTQSDSGDVLEPSLEEIVDMGRLRPPHDEEQDAQAAADRVDAYLDLVGQLELLMPDPETLLHDTALDNEGQEECSEATIPLAFSCVPSNFELNIEEMDLESKIVRQELRPDLSSVPENLLLQEEDLDDGDDSITPSNVTSLYSMPDLKISGADEIDDADKPLPSGDGDCVERYEGEPQEEREVVETEEVLPDGTVVRRKVVRKMVRQETLERRERQQEEDGLGHQEQEHGGEVVETEEVLPDGTVVSRRTTTHVTSETKVLRETIDEQHPQDHDQGGGQEVKAVQEPTKSKKKKKRKK